VIGMKLETDAIIVKITYAHKSGKGFRIHIPEAIVKALNIKKGDGFVWILNKKTRELKLYKIENRKKINLKVSRIF